VSPRDAKRQPDDKTLLSVKTLKRALDHRRAMYAKFAVISAEHAFDEIPSRGQFKRFWQRGYARRAKLRIKARKLDLTMDSRSTRRTPG
jgi:hypothetical protein